MDGLSCSTENLANLQEKLLEEPNSHSEVYRNLQPQPNVTLLENFLDFLEVSQDGHVLLGSSNLTGRKWQGSVWYYENMDLACKLTTYVANKSMYNGISDGKFLNDSSKVLVVDDSGGLHLLSLPENGDSPDDKLQAQSWADEHEGSVTEICMFASGNRFLTCSMDCSIKLWDLERTSESKNYFDSIKTFSNAHRDIVTSIATRTANEDLFVSCSSDRDTLLWDLRLGDQPAMGIYENSFCGLTNVKWHPLQENLVAISAENGVVYFIDLRDPDEFLTKFDCFNRSVYRLKFNDAGMLAVCADTNQFIVLNSSDLNNLKVVHEDDRHTDMVRGAAWCSDNVLLTCGWDRKIYKHQL